MSVSAPDSEYSGKVKAKRGIERTKPLFKKPDKIPTKLKEFEPGGSKSIEVPKTKPNHDLKSPNVVLQIVKKGQSPKPPDFKDRGSILPPTLKPKVAKPTLKLTKNINNNDVWTNEVKIKEPVATASLR